MLGVAVPRATLAVVVVLGRGLCETVEEAEAVGHCVALGVAVAQGLGEKVALRLAETVGQVVGEAVALAPLPVTLTPALGEGIPDGETEGMRLMSREELPVREGVEVALGQPEAVDLLSPPPAKLALGEMVVVVQGEAVMLPVPLWLALGLLLGLALALLQWEALGERVVLGEIEGLRESPGEREEEAQAEGERILSDVRVALPAAPPP